MAVCLHCKLPRLIRSRGLCRTCLDTPGVRDLYPRGRGGRKAFPIVVKLCKHCHTSKASRPRGLCWDCYFAPEIRRQYAAVSKFGRTGVGNGNRNAPLPEPTTIPPGPARVPVLAERAERGESLFHPADARGCLA